MIGCKDRKKLIGGKLDGMKLVVGLLLGLLVEFILCTYVSDLSQIALKQNLYPSLADSGQDCRS